MSRRSLLSFVLLNVLVTFVTVFAIIGLWTRIAPPPTRMPDLSGPPIVVTKLVTVVVTASGGQAGAPNINAATSDPRGTQVALVSVTPGSASASVPPTVGLGTVPTLDPSLLPPGLGPTNTMTPAPPGIATITPGVVETNSLASLSPSATAEGGCPTYALKKGDTLGSIGQTYGVPVADIMKANNLSESDLTRLQIGQVIIIPVNGCGLATEEPSATPTRFVVPTLPPTVTMVPTASTSQVEIVQVIGAGDITSEAVEIRNSSGGVIQMQGWQLTDAKGKIFTFPEFRIMPGGRVTIYTKDGANTPIVLYWGQPRAVWTDPNQEIVIIDSQGAVQVRRTVSGAPAPEGVTEPSGFTPTETKVP
jgi:LysM repeat protein